jgi:hypothetical protein
VEDTKRTSTWDGRVKTRKSFFLREDLSLFREFSTETCITCSERNLLPCSRDRDGVQFLSLPWRCVLYVQISWPG